MSTFDPALHGEPKSLLIEVWEGEGVRIRYKGEVVCQGRSMSDVLKTLSQFFGVQFTIVEDKDKVV